MIVSYDMDGVLALNPPPNIKKWGHMNGAERKARKEEIYRTQLQAIRRGKVNVDIKGKMRKLK